MRSLTLCVSLLALLAAGCEKAGNQGGSTAAAPSQTDIQGLQSVVTDPESRKFYEARGWAAAWDDKQAKALQDALAQADHHAINADAFVKDASAKGGEAEHEAGLTHAALAYAHALAFGVASPDKVFEVYTVPKPQADLGPGLAQALKDGRVGEWLASLAPSDPEYQALSAEYLRFKARAPADRRGPIPNGDKISPGKQDSRIPQIRESLRQANYLPAPQPQDQAGTARQSDAGGTVYTKDLAAAVARLQGDYGIKPDSVIGESTLEALNNGAAERARILAVNLERRRWLQRQLPQTRIDVNTAGAFLTYWRDGNVAHQARVVVGQPDWETPELGSPIVKLVANPDWLVPKSIEEKELRPKGAAYMKSQHIVEKNGRLVQESGPTNALGLVKFDMLNDQSIYLHDTPAKALFASDERHSSHGCVRVQDALGFARLLADNQGVRDQFEKALATGKESSVDLAQRIPVRLLYHTAYLENGRVVFRPDPYGWDDKLAMALGLGGAIRHHVIKHVEDVGP